jgi:hypothetical protein
VTQLIEALDRGVDAMIPEASMVGVYHAIFAAHRAGRRDEALRLFRLLLPVIAYTNQEIVTAIAFFKRLLVRKGIFQTETLRWPGVRWDSYNTRMRYCRKSCSGEERKRAAYPAVGKFFSAARRGPERIRHHATRYDERDDKSSGHATRRGGNSR